MWLVREAARVSQVEMQLSQCVSLPTWADVFSLQVGSETTHHDQGWDKTATVGRGVTVSRCRDAALERPWPCHQRWVVFCWRRIPGQSCSHCYFNRCLNGTVDPHQPHSASCSSPPNSNSASLCKKQWNGIDWYPQNALLFIIGYQ